MKDAISLGVGEPDLIRLGEFARKESIFGAREDFLYLQRRAERIKRGDCGLSEEEDPGVLQSGV